MKGAILACSIYSFILALNGCKTSNEIQYSETEKEARGILIRFSDFSPNFFHFIRLDTINPNILFSENLILENNLDTGIYIHNREPAKRFFNENESYLEEFSSNENGSIEAVAVTLNYTEYIFPYENEILYSRSDLVIDGYQINYIIMTERYSKITHLALIK
ncbi:MAG: hypothetical protein RJQ09_09745 [Cyclobacteriaceae bacterium]